MSVSNTSKDQRRGRQQHWKGSEFHPGKRCAGYKTPQAPGCPEPEKVKV